MSVVLAWSGVSCLRMRDPYYDGEPRQLEDHPSPFQPSEHGYQFSSFRGPVSGNIREISVPYVEPPGNPHFPQNRASGHPTTSVDYVAKPDYAFTFGVQDPETGNAQLRKEARDGDSVRGEYSVMEPDGTLRTVVYSADPVHGFQASVKYGPSGLPPPPPPTPPPTSGYTGTQQPRHRPRPRPLYRAYEDEEAEY
ncbi:cuticle protein 7-like [Homalodisca vitripennis]|uniref:cuticle protein 7-like n=1 Tax=Homalodisca vitripennis TaxID=197043 RepID=UPI001EEAC45C|nr:cuticle protein 7-like [Homalodisca vitripennis]KAG8279120.1 hypothetical protein J6590_003927 [Homalodisca vitripennis]